jgi:hypothetical protein
MRMGLVAVAASSALVLGACGGGQAGGQQGGAAQGGGNPGASTSSACAAASQILNKPQSYTGKQVTVTGTVRQVVDPHAFSVTTGNSDRSAAQTLLAVDKQATSLTAGSPVQITGTLQPAFSPEAAQAFTGASPGQAALTAYNGKPYLQAMFTGPVSANLSRGQGGVFGVGSSGCGSANQVVKDMQSYTGQQVTMTGAIGQVVGPHAFTLIASGNAQGATPQAVLVATKEAISLTAGSPVQITGTLQPAFSPEAAQAFTGASPGQAALTAYNGKPYVQAMFIGPVSANLSGGQGAG